MRDALKRIQKDTYGKCVVDGEPIDERRLEAVRWTPYCGAHAEMFEKPDEYRTATV